MGFGVSTGHRNARLFGGYLKKSHSFSLGLFLVLFFLNVSAFATDPFPSNPDPSLTPGALCRNPDSYRYPEKIPYCNRNVSPATKDAVIQDYDVKLGYSVQKFKRDEFKIDHYIPLCMGGSNEPSNLWPQHLSVYKVTDPLEPAFCEKMAKGRLRQIDAVEMIRRAKNDLKSVPEVLRYVQSL